jgi:putative copper resistance protein D
VLVVACLAGALHVIGVRRLASRGRRWPRLRTLPFLAGCASLAAADLLPSTTERFSTHVVEHLVLGMAAPLLLALGAPITLLLQASSRPMQLAVLRLLRGRVVRVVTNPLVAFAVFAATPAALWFSPLFEWSLDHGWVHALVHLHFVVAGSLFVWPLVGLDPVRARLPHGARLLQALLVVPLHAFLGVAIVGSTSLLVDGAPWSLDDQHLGGAILWATGDVLAFGAAAAIFWQWVRAEARVAVRADRRSQLLEAGDGPA